jgi:hypothetical protein
MPYRRRDASDQWHWCRNCSKWPIRGYEEELGKPLAGELCGECRVKLANGTCQP